MAGEGPVACAPLRGDVPHGLRLGGHGALTGAGLGGLGDDGRLGLLNTVVIEFLPLLLLPLLHFLIINIKFEL